MLPFLPREVRLRYVTLEQVVVRLSLGDFIYNARGDRSPIIISRNALLVIISARLGTARWLTTWNPKSFLNHTYKVGT